MRSLEIMEYVEILHKLEIRGAVTDWAYWMLRWDEVRTDINPNAKWYDDSEVKESESQLKNN